MMSLSEHPLSRGDKVMVFGRTGRYEGLFKDNLVVVSLDRPYRIKNKRRDNGPKNPVVIMVDNILVNRDWLIPF